MKPPTTRIGTARASTRRRPRLGIASAIVLAFASSCASPPPTPAGTSQATTTATPDEATPSVASAIAPAPTDSPSPSVPASPSPGPDLAGPLRWFAPLPPGRPDLPFADGSADYFDLFAQGAPWDVARQSVDVFKVYASWVDAYATDEQLRLVVKGAADRGMALAVEMGGLPASNDCGNGVEGFGASLGAVRRLEAAGGTVRLVAFDEPYAFGHAYSGPAACRWPVDRLARELANFVEELRAAEPGIRIGDIEPLWAEISATDFGAWMDAYLNATGTPFDFVHLDADWALADWPERAVAVTQEARSRRISAGLVYNGGDARSDAAWDEAAREHIDTYEARLGGPPDQIVFQSWMDHPDHALPDSDPTTFTGLIRQYAGRRSTIALGSVRESGGRVDVRGTSQTRDAGPLAGATIRLSAIPLDGVYQVPSIEGTVPARATSAVIGLRVNTEGVGPGPVHLRAYLIRYSQSGETRNRVPDPAFAARLAKWPPDGTAHATVVPSDRARGRMLRIESTKGESLIINSVAFPVTAGARYRFSAGVRLAADSAANVYLAVIFLRGTELARERLDLAPGSIALGALSVDASGAFHGTSKALEAGRYRIRVDYPGDADHWPAHAEATIDVG